jgi:hypothetical protein
MKTEQGGSRSSLAPVADTIGGLATKSLSEVDMKEYNEAHHGNGGSFLFWR